MHITKHLRARNFRIGNLTSEGHPRTSSRSPASKKQNVTKTKNGKLFPTCFWRWGGMEAPLPQDNPVPETPPNVSKKRIRISTAARNRIVCHLAKLQKKREKNTKLWKQTFVPFCYFWNRPQLSHSTEPSPGGPYSQFWSFEPLNAL